ncbi:X-pro dipeptidyl-peptidase [Fusarium subglutinans]|uniref:X-pro dipeptidyl-peptidase n=1 Tax=Gibberella subglutinans TaxID=42677 RepID=A0A8H5KV77_GIBSU|nr:X-pro dipeptidyl-peptidase [Fusarium subglutinans]KAF5580048.1 X-pro dipeptidyl-peptidase [Fusarium subglutinans]
MNFEKLGTDLRETLSLTRNRQAIRRSLQSQSPPLTLLDSNIRDYKTDGLDCLIVLVRHIYSEVLDVYYSGEENKTAEEKNPILALAWLDIDPEDKKAWADCKRHVLEVLNPAEGGTIQTCFASLVNSPLMNETFWSQDIHILFRACLEKSLEANSRWRHADLGPNPRAAMVELSTIVADRNAKPDWTFRQFVRSPFKILKKHDKQQLNMCAAPAIIRVHLKTNKDVEPFPFSTLKNFQIDIAGVNGSEPIVKDMLCGYTLIASVSLKEQRIRTYRPLGEEIVRGTGYLGRRWSLENREDGEFMLFYRRSDDAVADSYTPETVTIPKEMPTLAIVNNALQEDIDRRRAQRAAEREEDERAQMEH